LLRFAGVKLEINGKMLVSKLKFTWLAYFAAVSASNSCFERRRLFQSSALVKIK